MLVRLAAGLGAAVLVPSVVRVAPGMGPAEAAATVLAALSPGGMSRPRRSEDRRGDTP